MEILQYPRLQHLFLVLDLLFFRANEFLRKFGKMVLLLTFLNVNWYNAKVFMIPNVFPEADESL